MPESKRRNALIGLFVLGGFICLAILIVKFGETQAWFGNRYRIKATYDRIAGVGRKCRQCGSHRSQSTRQRRHSGDGYR
jgi:ABC-type transporter Mla subunit MlaD